MKTCSKCKEAKPLSEFHKNRVSVDGLTAACKSYNKTASRLRYAEDGSYRESNKLASAKWRKANPDRCRELAGRCYRAKRIESEVVESEEERSAQARKNELERKQRLPDYYKAALNAWGHSQRRNRVPPWAKLASFLPIYADRITCGPEYVVDHIIPLSGKFVSGLHVPANLQILTREQNQAKGNNFELAA